MAHNWNKLMDLRREAAKERNQDRWSISPLSDRDKEYAKNVDKDGLTREQRLRVEAAKDRITYPEDDFSEVWD